jgi:hypothetical protein
VYEWNQDAITRDWAEEMDPVILRILKHLKDMLPEHADELDAVNHAMLTSYRPSDQFTCHHDKHPSGYFYIISVGEARTIRFMKPPASGGDVVCEHRLVPGSCLRVGAKDNRLVKHGLLAERGRPRGMAGGRRYSLIFRAITQYAPITATPVCIPDICVVPAEVGDAGHHSYFGEPALEPCEVVTPRLVAEHPPCVGHVEGTSKRGGGSDADSRPTKGPRTSGNQRPVAPQEAPPTSGTGVTMQ